MITTILTKVLDELSKEKPDISYVRGMCEVLLASQPKVIDNAQAFNINAEAMKPFTPVVQDEAAAMDAKARASLETIKALAQVETE